MGHLSEKEYQEALEPLLQAVQRELASVLASVHEKGLA